MTEMKARLVDKDGNPLGTAANPLKISGDVGGGVPDGGTTGQVLQKKTDADQDTEWGDGSGASSYDDLTDIPAAISAIDGLTPAANKIPYYTAADSGALADLPSGYNYIINPCFEVNQRGVASVNLIWGRPVDMWLMAVDGATLTASQQAFTAGQTDVPGNPKNYLRCVVGAGSAAGDFASLQCRLEDVRTLAGQTVTLSFWAKADATKNISIALNQYFGTGGSPSAVVYMHVEKLEISPIWDRYAVTFQFPSIAGKTIGTSMSGYIIIIVYLDAGTDRSVLSDDLGHQSGTFEFANIKLESGSVATPFRVPTYAEELLKCQRYFQILGGSNIYEHVATGVAYSTTQYSGIIPIPVPMRTIPSIVNPTSYANFAISNETTTAALNANPLIATSYSSVKTVGILCTVASGLTSGTTYFLRSANQTTDKIGLSAEL